MLVLTDTQSHTLLGQPKGESWDRMVHARLIDKLREHRARAVVFDVWFDGAHPHRPRTDAALVDAVRAHGHVAVAGFRQHTKVQHSDVLEWKPPFPALAETAPWGIVTFGSELGTVVRQPELGTVYAGREALASVVVRLLGGEPPASHRALWLNYYGPPRTIESVPYWQVLSNAIPADRFAGKLVFVGDFNDDQGGTTGGWRTDEAATPYTRWTGDFSPGVEIVATTTLNFLNGDYLQRLSPLTETLLVLLAGILSGYGFTRLRPFTATNARQSRLSNCRSDDLLRRSRSHPECKRSGYSRGL